MSTKAEIKRKKDLKKKISIAVKAVFAVILIILGLIYYGSGKDGGKDDAPSDIFSIKPVEENADSKKQVLEPAKKNSENTKTGDSSSKKDEEIDKNAVVTPPDKSDNGSKTEKEDDITASANHYTEDGRLDINLATIDELCKLNGIGAKRAADIIEYRETNGNFKNIEDIMKVKGIKQGVFSKIKDYITCPAS